MLLAVVIVVLFATVVRAIIIVIITIVIGSVVICTNSCFKALGLSKQCPTRPETFPLAGMSHDIQMRVARQKTGLPKADGITIPFHDVGRSFTSG